jgi:ribose-phosphate pyrophosphokinase
MNGRQIKLIDGSANTELVKAICYREDLYEAEADVIIDTFSDGESKIEISENMRGCDVFVVQPTSSPANKHWMELFLILDALKRSNCWRVTAVIPYYGYARQDKKLKPRVPISAKAMADMIQAVGVDRILTMDLHSNQIQGYFNCPVDNLFASSIFTPHIESNFIRDNDVPVVMVSPDEGGIARVVHYAKKFGCSAAMIHKSRIVANEVDDMILLGSVRDMRAIIIDDMIDTATTLCKAASILKGAGAVSVDGYASHGVFSGKAYHKIAESAFDVIHVTDSIKQSALHTDKIDVISCADLLANAILNIHNETSVSCLFDN